MRSFTSDELDRMQSTQEGAMQDTGQVLQYSSSADGYGNPSATFTAQSAISCGVEHVNPDEIQESGDVPVMDVRIRLPIDTVIDPRDRFRVTHRYGEALSAAKTYEIEGPVKRGPSGLVILGRLVD